MEQREADVDAFSLQDEKTDVASLEETFQEIYKSTFARITPSGLLAASAALRGVLSESAGPRIIVHDIQLRPELKQLISCVVRDLAGVTAVAVDCSSQSNLLRAFDTSRLLKSARFLVIFAEACCDMTGEVFAFGALSELKARRTSDLVVIIDDSSTTAAGCDALNLRADVVTSSLAGYYSANAVSDAGLITGSERSVMNRVLNWCDVNGLRVSSQTALAILANVPSFAARFHKAGDAAVRVVTALSGERVTLGHPCLPPDARYARTTSEFLQAWPAVFAVTTDACKSKSEFFRAVRRSSVLSLSSAIGGARTCVDPAVTIVGRSITFRVSVGYGGGAEIRCDRIVEDIRSLINPAS
jgi:cystathionine beta-lyase/cystathionine gamma-synthase